MGSKFGKIYYIEPMGTGKNGYCDIAQKIYKIRLYICARLLLNNGLIGDIILDSERREPTQINTF